MNTTTTPEVQATTVSIPCGWCDEPVAVAEDRGQIVYCSETHARLDGYVAVDAL